MTTISYLAATSRMAALVGDAEARDKHLPVKDSNRVAYLCAILLPSLVRSSTSPRRYVETIPENEVLCT